MRIEGKGLIDRSRRIPFTFDGQALTGFAGDTLASALLANDVHLVGRSFKYHRPRGILTAGSEEPNALVTLGTGARQDPNIRATTQELFGGLVARSQNRWPSLRLDLLSVNDLAAPFLGAGFYYKTFMWPRAFWEKIYEPAIRRAAGLGALSGDSNPDIYEKAYAFCDLLVIGSGPTGLMAALTAARAGADVILAEEDSQFGGRLLSETETIDQQPGVTWAEGIVTELAALPNVRLMPRTTVTGAYDQNTYGALERVSHHRRRRPDLPLECFWRIVAKQTVLAAGALERPIAFRDNDRPGIMMAGAVRSYLNRWGVSPGQAVTVFATNDNAHRTARELAAAGVHVAAVIDSRHDAPGSDAFPVLKGAQVCASHGRRRLESITIRRPSGEERIQTDCLAMSGGWNPAVHLTCHMGGRPVWRDDIMGFVPPAEGSPGAVPGLIPAGACTGIYATAGCLHDGIRAARRALDALDLATPDMPQPVCADQSGADQPEDAPNRSDRLWAVPGKGRAWLDFQNDVTVKDVAQAAQENFRSVEHMKRYTTQGMAPDQGKNSNVAALAILADATGRDVAQTGTTTFRPPYVPVSIAAMGAGGQGAGFAPQRLTTSHAASLDMGAPMIEAGLWYRPSYFPRAGEKTWRQSCDREVNMVRQAVGICDVSTLGKIDLQGPDAGAFLDFVYTNTFSTLKVGRTRYGLMLREDGHVMDDGTTARLGDQHFLMTTTTAAAGEVMRHLDFVHQCHCPHLDVRFASVTEQWAQFAIAGPRARDLLDQVLGSPLKPEDWPFMACGPVSVTGVAARLFRISFSGEHAYELAVPARWGDSLFRGLVAQAEQMGGGAYGMEALNVLRLEKGLITHAEIHGRITAYDIGAQRMVSSKKDCIGKTMASRPGLCDPARARLVGLKPAGAVQMLTAGAHLYSADADPVRQNHQGYVTSNGFSPTLGHVIALGFLQHGPERVGEVIKMVDHVRDVETMCTVVPPVFFDPTGGRARD